MILARWHFMRGHKMQVAIRAKVLAANFFRCDIGMMTPSKTVTSLLSGNLQSSVPWDAPPKLETLEKHTHAEVSISTRIWAVIPRVPAVLRSLKFPDSKPEVPKLIVLPLSGYLRPAGTAYPKARHPEIHTPAPQTLTSPKRTLAQTGYASRTL